MRQGSLVGLALLGICAAACGEGPTTPRPSPNVPTAAPRDTTVLEGLSRVRLYRLVDRLAAGRHGEVHSLIVQRNGVPVIEEYFSGGGAPLPHSLQSVTKSFGSALLGIAIDKGLVSDVDERVLDFFPQWDEELRRDARRDRMRLKDILTMRTGTDYHEEGPDAPHWELNSLPTGWDLYWLRRRMIREPGSFWQYDSGGVIALSSILKHRTGVHADVLADRWLFQPLGINEARWFTNQEGHPHLGGGLSLTTRSMAKFGQLYLQGGTWNGQQIVSQEWIQASWERHVDFQVPATSSQHIRWYGYLWWILEPDPDGAGVQDIYAAVGAGGQFIFVIPEHQMVVAVTSDVQRGEQWTPVTWLYSDILPALLR